MTHEEKVARWIGPGKIGAEIGAGKVPIPGLSPAPIYVDCFTEFGGASCRADYYGHAAALPFHSNSLDYVASSHVLEHVANPLAALAEWYRVLRPDGIVYLVVPDRRHTWDHTRQLTPVEHMVDDFIHGTTPCDATHIDEFVYDTDWSRFSPATEPADRPERQAQLASGMRAAVERGEGINIHFHTFEPSTLVQLFGALRSRPGQRMRWEILEQIERFPKADPNGILTVARAKKGWRDRAEADWFRIRTNGDPRAVVREDAEPFADYARKCSGLGGVR
jgi:SAM-dependent methyltransferase